MTVEEKMSISFEIILPTNGKRIRERKKGENRHLNISMYLSFRGFGKKVLLTVILPVSVESVKGFPSKVFSNMTARDQAEMHAVKC